MGPIGIFVFFSTQFYKPRGFPDNPPPLHEQIRPLRQFPNRLNVTMHSNNLQASSFEVALNSPNHVQILKFCCHEYVKTLFDDSDLTFM